MNEAQYVTLFSKFYRTIVNDRLPLDSAALHDVVKADWAADRLGRVSITKSHFRRLIFQLADLWTVRVSVDAYADFLRRVMHAILERTEPSSPSAQQRRFLKTTVHYRLRHDRNIRHYDPMMLSHTSRKTLYFHCKLSAASLESQELTPAFPARKHVQEDVEGVGSRMMVTSRSPPIVRQMCQTTAGKQRFAPHSQNGITRPTKMNVSLSSSSSPLARSSAGAYDYDGNSSTAGQRTRGINEVAPASYRLKVGLPSTPSEAVRMEETITTPLVPARSPSSRRRRLTERIAKKESPKAVHDVRRNMTGKPKELTTAGTRRTDEPPHRPKSNQIRPKTPTIRLALGKSRTRKEVKHLCHSMGLSPHMDQVHQLDGISSSQNYEVDLNNMWQTRIKRTQINVATRSPRNKLAVVI